MYWWEHHIYCLTSTFNNYASCVDCLRYFLTAQFMITTQESHAVLSQKWTSTDVALSFQPLPWPFQSMLSTVFYLTYFGEDATLLPQGANKTMFQAFWSALMYWAKKKFWPAPQKFMCFSTSVIRISGKIPQELQALSLPISQM